MKLLHFLLVDVVETLLRVLPFPCKTGLVKVGTPDRNSPVLLTCNFRLTVTRVLRALRGQDAYLLVANSRGVNVWCAATGGLLTNHDVVSVLKTSGIEQLVDHRKIILPQLAATGIEGKIIQKKTGWKIVWGPVYATSIPEFFATGQTKTPELRRVRFPLSQRLEMAVAWAFPISLLALLLLPLWREGVLPLMGLVWGLSLLIFSSFPLYERQLRSTGKHVGFVFFDFGERGLPLLFWALFMLGLAGYMVWTGAFSLPFFLRWSFSALIVILILGLDLAGSTPLYKSGLHADRLLRITLDAERCKGVGDCEEVCPVEVITVDSSRKRARLVAPDRCVQCGGCIVQCPFDALSLSGPTGKVVTPEVIRQFKLNLLGTRREEPSLESA